MCMDFSVVIEWGAAGGGGGGGGGRILRGETATSWATY